MRFALSLQNVLLIYICISGLVPGLAKLGLGGPKEGGMRQVDTISFLMCMTKLFNALPRMQREAENWVLPGQPAIVPLCD